MVCWFVNGFQGAATDIPDLTFMMSKRKPRPLTAAEKANNTKINRRRILNEHAIGAVKRLRASFDIYRNIRQNILDDIMLAACGLWNYRQRED